MQIVHNSRKATTYSCALILFSADNYSLRDPYDKIITCLGFKVRGYMLTSLSLHTSVFVSSTCIHGQGVSYSKITGSRTGPSDPEGNTKVLHFKFKSAISQLQLNSDLYDIVFQTDFSIFNHSVMPEKGLGKKSKYPRITPDYQSQNIPRLWFGKEIGLYVSVLDTPVHHVGKNKRRCMCYILVCVGRGHINRKLEIITDIMPCCAFIL